jgi:5-formyltetrahydrofolate cyclo-ligase
VKTLRSSLRQRRAGLAPGQVSACSTRIARHLWRLPLLARSARIACYLAVNGEVDCLPIMREAVRRGRRIYLPVLHGPSLRFAPWLPGCPLTPNRYGIPEPVTGLGGWLPAAELDVVFTPLVAFDASGNRLGMGGGYYDRALAFTRRRSRWHRPAVIGLGYAFQQVDALPARSWDIRLHGAVTEHGARFF